MTEITTREDLVTLITVFTVEPSKQDQVVDLLTRVTDETIRHQPGFLSANIHKSVDGTRVTNYVQWRSRADLEAMLQHPDTTPHVREAARLATYVDPNVYEVAAVRSSRRAPGSLALGAAATGALALGAFAVGALAIGRLAIGALTLKRGRVRVLSIEEVEIGRLGVRELVVSHETNPG